MPDDELTGDRVTDGQSRADVRVTDVRVTNDRVTNNRVTGDQNPPTLMFCFLFFKNGLKNEGLRGKSPRCYTRNLL